MQRLCALALATLLMSACQAESPSDVLDTGEGVVEDTATGEEVQVPDADLPEPRDVVGADIEPDATHDEGLMACPQPVIVIDEGEEVCPTTTLHLHGSQSVPGTGQIVSYSWTVDQPAENTWLLTPNSNFDNPTHQVAVAGTYRYCLDVCDNGRCSSDPACDTTDCKTVQVVPCSDALQCELTWDTPNDPDQQDSGYEAGTDMDIHLLHPLAMGPDVDQNGSPDGWFDLEYDLFWGNPHPQWAANEVAAEAGLDRDDIDGAGPENINLEHVESGGAYTIGVHYWDEGLFGPSYARLKCYLAGQLVFDMDSKSTNTRMMECDLWVAATVQWPQGMVTAVTDGAGGLKVVRNYTSPTVPCQGPKTVPSSTAIPR